MFSPLFSFAFAPNFAVPVPTRTDDTPSPEHIPAIQTAIPDVPITVLRPVFNPDLGTNTRLPNPGTCIVTASDLAPAPHNSHALLTPQAPPARTPRLPSSPPPAGPPTIHQNA